MLFNFLLHTVATQDVPKIIEYINAQTNSSLNFKSKTVDLLRDVIISDQTDIFEIIMKYAFKIDDIDSTHGSTPIMFATQRGRVKMTERLLKHGASIKVDSACIKSALSFCFDSKLTDDHLTCVELLIKAESDIEHLKQLDSVAYRICCLLKQDLATKIKPVETVGFIDAPAICEPKTHLDLNSFHKVASETNTTATLCPEAKKETEQITDLPPSDTSIGMASRKCDCFMLQFVKSLEQYLVIESVLDNTRHVVSLKNMRIPIPFALNKNKILWHILPFGTKIDNDCSITSPMKCKIVSAFNYKDGAFCPDKIYF